MERVGAGHRRSAWCPQGPRSCEGEEASVREGAAGVGVPSLCQPGRLGEGGFRQQVVLGPGPWASGTERGLPWVEGAA